MKKDKIHFILTGGTIDSYYDPTKDTTVPNKKSVIPAFIESLKLYDNFEFTEVCMKDSREINNSDRKKILNYIKKSSSDKIVITHGTYTMPDTAKYIEYNLKNNKKVILVTGSMIPLIGFSPSDAPFHLGFALAKLRELSPGVYVAMNGKIFSPQEIVKIASEGRFESIFNK